MDTSTPTTNGVDGANIISSTHLSDLRNLSEEEKAQRVATLVKDISNAIVDIGKLVESGVLSPNSTEPLKTLLYTIQAPNRKRSEELEGNLKVKDAEITTLKDMHRGEMSTNSARLASAMQELRIEMMRAKAETEVVRREFETMRGHMEGLKHEREAFVARIAELEEALRGRRRSS